MKTPTSGSPPPGGLDTNQLHHRLKALVILTAELPASQAVSNQDLLTLYHIIRNVASAAHVAPGVSVPFLDPELMYGLGGIVGITVAHTSRYTETKGKT